MEYKVVYEKAALKKIQKMDRMQRSFVLSWIDKNLNNTSNPRKFGKALKGSYDNYWRYRVGNYRLIAKIDDQNIIIFLIDAGHRKDIYM